MWVFIKDEAVLSLDGKIKFFGKSKRKKKPKHETLQLDALFFILTCFSFSYLHNTLYLKIGRDHVALPRPQWLWICNEKLLLSCLLCWKFVFSRNLIGTTLKTTTKKHPAQPQKASLKRKIQTLSVPSNSSTN